MLWGDGGRYNRGGDQLVVIRRSCEGGGRVTKDWGDMSPGQRIKKRGGKLELSSPGKG